MNKFLTIIFLFMACSIAMLSQQSVADSLMHEMSVLKEDTSKIIILNKLAMMLYNNNPEKSLEYSEEALKISVENDYLKYLPVTYSALAAANWALSNYSIGLDYLFKKLKIHETKNEYTDVAKTYKRIAIILNDNDKDSLALTYIHKSLTICIEHENNVGIADAYNIIANIHFEGNQYEGVEDYWQKALRIYTAENKILKAASIEHNLGMLYYDNQNYEKALKSFNYLLNTCEDYHNKLCVVTALENIGSVYVKTKKYQLAETCFLQQLDTAKKYGFSNMEMKAYSLLAELDTIKKNYKSAFDHYTKYTQLKDSIFTREKEKQISELQIQYETEKTEKENISLRRKKKINSLVVLALGISLISVILILSIMWKLIRIKQANNVVLKKKNEKIIFQKYQISEQNEELKIQSEELILHEEHLMELVNKRTKELVKAKEKAEESDKLKSAFLTNVSHEIRTPMNAIIGFSDLIALPDISDNERDKYLGIIQKSSSKLLNLIDDILDLSKIEVEKVNLHKVEFELKEAMLDFLSRFSSQKKMNIKLMYDNEGSNDQISIYTDQARFRQIMDNLLNNAFKFTDSGFVNFGFNIRDDQKIEFYVKDTGIGISKDMQEKIFDRFRKIEDKNSKLYQGTGLGLAISKSLTEMLGGEIWLDSKYGNGSFFKFTLPYNKK